MALDELDECLLLDPTNVQALEKIKFVKEKLEMQSRPLIVEVPEPDSPVL